MNWCRRIHVFLLTGVLAITTCTALSGCRKKPKAGGKKVIVLGFDGMEPTLVQRLMDEGKLPNFSKLAAKGGYWKLGTSIPPQSPVAWSNFITGSDPGAHGIFDFIHRKWEKETAEDGTVSYHLIPFFSANETTEGDDPIQVFNYKVPIPLVQKSAELLLKRGGTPFWDYLDERGIPSMFYRLPANYPPSKSKYGHMKALSGMGTTDLEGSQGMFQWFSPEFDEEITTVSGGGGGYAIGMIWDDEHNRWVCKLKGIDNPMVADLEDPLMRLPVYIEPDRTEPVAKLYYVNQSLMDVEDQKVELLLEEGEWSPWEPVVFRPSALDSGAGTRGMVRFWLRKVHPEPELYVTPINFDPEHMAATVSEPPDLVTEMGKEIGPFYTQGFAEDFKALDAKQRIGYPPYDYTERLFDADDYEQQAQMVLDERKRILDYALKHYTDGLLFVYFSSSDLVAHMFYWEPEAGQPEDYTDHPTRKPDAAEKYTKFVRNVYEQCDQQLGRVLAEHGDDATIIVMSDHGFMRYKRKLNLNTWLRNNRFITIKEGIDEKTGSLNEIADWSKTQAYSVGLNGIYLNLKGREPMGCVDPSEREAVLNRIIDALKTTRDPLDDSPVVRNVYRTDQVYHGPYAPGGDKDQNTPDLIVGFERGYVVRSGGTGDIAAKWIRPNTSEWSADHCIAAELVPGILLSNRRIVDPDPNLTDLAPTILGLFGIDRPDTITGRNLFDPNSRSKVPSK